MSENINIDDTISIDCEPFSGSLFDISDRADENLALFDVTVLTASERDSGESIVLKTSSGADEWIVKWYGADTEQAISASLVTVVDE